MKTVISSLTMAMLPLGVFAQGNLSSGIDLSDLDQTVSPGENFYQYACGGWMKKHPLPAAYSRFGSFDKLGQDNNERINGILKELTSAKQQQGSIAQKIADLYTLAMDSVRRNKEGVTPLMPLLKEMDKAKNIQQLFAVQCKYAAFGYGVPMGAGFGADEKNASQNILNVSQSGLTLGQKEYYLDNDEATTNVREEYKKFIVRMFALFGKAKDAQKKMQNILELETELAKVSKSATELRDVEANYNKMSLATFESQYPHLKLRELLNAEGVDTKYIQTMVVGQPAFLAGADKIFANITPEVLRDYMQWNAIISAANFLSDDVAKANFEFFGKTMRGRKSDYPRWKRATQQVEAQLGEALGHMYVDKYFPAEAKARMQQLVANLQTSLAERIKAQTWMSDTTKQAALDKLSSFYVKIGYPDKWTDYSLLSIDPTKSYYENVQACRLFRDKKSIDDKAGKPVDRDQWYMTPQTVNAYYNPTTNEICFPAGILQKPFFDMNADDAFNYGAIGVVIGHEMTHGFDDQGRHYDRNGNMSDWWTDADAKNFSERANGYASFFSAIKVLPDLNANGKLTLGENLADHGGLQVAYNAYLNATKNSPLSTVDGLTPEQRFFLAYAGVWAGNITEKEIRTRTKSDPHSLSIWRVNGALPHIDAWYKAFNIKQNDKMYLPESQRLQLW